jgi:catechol 2,3-dioxygenase-like lactoylglutathione lyase family enzyme
VYDRREEQCHSAKKQYHPLHICLRAPDVPSVDAFHAAALKAGGASDGDPGVRIHYDEGYYAAFIRDPDGNLIEAVRFLRSRV